MTDPTAELHEAMPFSATLAVSVLSYAAEEVRARLEWQPSLCTAGGVLHGGAIMALADSTGGACASLNLPSDAAGTTTIESKSNFLGSVRSGGVTAVSTPLHVGRTIIVVETDVVDDDGRRIARTTQTQLALMG